MEISIRAGIAIFGWYACVFCAGMWLLLDKMFYSDVMNSEVNLETALLCALGAALISCSLYYIRKLYKDLFQAKPSEVAPSGKVALATVMYFVSRPFFAALFAILVVISTATLIHATTVHGTKLSAGFIFLTVLVSAYGAAVTGRVINQLESIGLEKLRKFGGF